MRKVISIFLAVMLLAALALTAFAESTTNLRLSLVDETTPIVGATFEIYHVGEKDSTGLLKLTGEFADYPVEINGLGEDTSQEANALYGFAKMDGLTSDAVVTTDASGTATATALESGVYLIGGQPYEYQGVIYHTEPLLVVLPCTDAVTGELDYEPVLSMKFIEENKETVDLKVLKIWNDHSGHGRPGSITVHLLKDGAVYDTVILTAENRWRHVWRDLDASALWQIAEEVPWPYTVQVEREGNTFLLKNYAPELPPPQEPTQPQQPTQPTVPSDKIPQTGMLWWPVLLLGGLGVALVIGGVMLRKGSKE